jgi:2-oxoglutarate dehydrogenase complex dehydrogenase (E1) component-like enzyme
VIVNAPPLTLPLVPWDAAPRLHSQIYYDLLKTGPHVPESVGVLRLEELAPFPAAALRRHLQET